MMLGGKKRQTRAAIQQLRHKSRGQLNADLWATDPAHQAYFDAVGALDKDLLAVTDGGRIEVDPLNREERAAIESLTAPFVKMGNPRLNVCTDSYMWSEAESWEDYDAADFAAMLERGCAELGGQMNEPRFRFGGSWWGVFGHHPSEPVQAPLEAFTPAWDYLRSRAAWLRLEALAEHNHTMFFPLMPEEFFGLTPEGMRNSAGLTASEVRRLFVLYCAAGVLVERFLNLRRAGLWA